MSVVLWAGINLLRKMVNEKKRREASGGRAEPVVTAPPGITGSRDDASTAPVPSGNIGLIAACRELAEKGPRDAA